MTDKLETRTVTVTLGPEQSKWLDDIRGKTEAQSDEDALRLALFAAHLVLTPDEFKEVLSEALHTDKPQPIHVTFEGNHPTLRDLSLHQIGKPHAHGSLDVMTGETKKS